MPPQIVLRTQGMDRFHEKMEILFYILHKAVTSCKIEDNLMTHNVDNKNKR
jgi:hypothetical protein